MVENIPAPITAAIPIKVKSFTPNTFLSPAPCPSAAAASELIFAIDFFLNKEFDMRYELRLVCVIKCKINFLVALNN